jgi:hypothetical protein
VALIVKKEYLDTFLEYNPDTGLLFYKHCASKSNMWNSKYAGMQAGSLLKGKYIQIKFDGYHYLAHRLAWIIMTGEQPDDQIDHIDGDGLNNRFNNLREATQAQNMANCERLVRGIYEYPNGKWKALIGIDHERIYLGLFNTKEEAYTAYQAALIETHGEYAIYNRRLPSQSL